MEELIRQILLLPLPDRKKLAKIISASFENSGEGFYYSFDDYSADQKVIIKQRYFDVELEKVCLIEFDDHILSIK